MDQSTPPAAPPPAARTDSGAAGPGAAPAGNALSSMQQVVELADGLAAVADRLHERILRDIRSHDGNAVPDRVQAALRALLDDEMLLRQRANGLYADAAAYVIDGLREPQARLVALTADAADKIRRIGVLAEATGLVGGMLALAGAVASGLPGPIVLALEKIRLHNAALDALSPPASGKGGGA